MQGILTIAIYISSETEGSLSSVQGKKLFVICYLFIIHTVSRCFVGLYLMSDSIEVGFQYNLLGFLVYLKSVVNVKILLFKMFIYFKCII